MERAEGRNRSEIDELDRRLQSLDEDMRRLPLPRPTDTDGSLAGDGKVSVEMRASLFTLEAYAATVFLRLRAELFESRMGMPKNDADVFTILQRHERLDQVEARKLRQFCEARFLSSRDLAKLDLASLQELVENRGWISELLARFAKTTP